MATKLDPELIKQMLSAQTFAPQPIDQQVPVQAAASGIGLADTILKNKQSQEDRIRTLKEKVEAAKREADYKKKASLANPAIANEISYIPEKAAESILKGNLASQSDEAKLARVRQAAEAPDRVKQLFQLADGTTVGVTYGGQIKPIDVPGGGKLNPMTKALPAEQLEKTGTFEAMNDLIQRVKSDITDPKTGQMSQEGKNLIGLVDAPTQKAAAYTPAADPMATSFYQKVQDLKNQIIYLRSGKQINEEEYKRLRASLPSEYRDESVFLSDLSNFERTFQDVAAKRKQAFIEGGYKVPSMGVQTPPAGNPGKKTGFRVISVRPSGGQ